MELHSIQIYRCILGGESKAEPKAKHKKTASHEMDDDDFVLRDVGPASRGRRQTRVSTGVMQRKSILDIIGEASARKDADILDTSSSKSGNTPKIGMCCKSYKISCQMYTFGVAWVSLM